MKLKEYIKNLQEVAKEFGDDLEVIFSADDEGNYYDEVYADPSVGNFHQQEFVPLTKEESDEEELEINSVCIN